MKNKAKTKQQFLDALAEILAEDGYGAVGVNKVAKRAIRTKELMYRYFGGLDGLLTEFVAENDYWMNCLGGIDTARLAGPDNADSLKEVVVAILQNQLLDFFDEPVLQELIAYSVDREPAALKRRFSEGREREGERLLQLTDNLFADTEIPFRGIAAIFVAGTDYLALHASRNRGAVCGLDLNAPRTQEQLLQVIDFYKNKMK